MFFLSQDYFLKKYYKCYKLHYTPIDYAFRQLSKNHPVISKLRFGQNCEANTAGYFWDIRNSKYKSGGVLPYIRYIGMCRPKGYGFWAVSVWKRV